MYSLRLPLHALVLRVLASYACSILFLGLALPHVPLLATSTAQFTDGVVPNYDAGIRASKFCMSPYGHGWGIRTSIYMASGCVPVIIQDHVFQVSAYKRCITHAVGQTGLSSNGLCLWQVPCTAEARDGTCIYGVA
jgi:hypothetical protein